MAILMTSLALVLLSAAVPQAGEYRLLIDLEMAPTPWHDSRLGERLDRVFSRNPDVRVVMLKHTEQPADPPRPMADLDVDSLMNWGQELGGRYLLSLQIHREDIKRKKSFSLPLVFHRYKTMAVIEGELRLLDLVRGRVLAAEDIKYELEASSQFQAEWDDNRHDANLHLTSPQKSELFAELETRFAEDLQDKIKDFLQGR